MKINDFSEGSSPLGKINKFLRDKERKEEYARKLQKQRDEKEVQNEEWTDDVRNWFGAVDSKVKRWAGKFKDTETAISDFKWDARDAARDYYKSDATRDAEQMDKALKSFKKGADHVGTHSSIAQYKINKSNKKISEDFGSVPPLTELIIMAVIAKTSVDTLMGMFKVALKTGKGLKKLNDLRKKASQIGKNVADYAMPHESINESKEETLQGFDPETIANLKALKARYPHAPDELSALMKSLLDIKKASQRDDDALEIEVDDAEDRIDDLEKRISDLEKDTVKEKTTLRPSQKSNPEVEKRIMMNKEEMYKEAALAALERLVDSKGSRHALNSYAFEISRAFGDITVKELIKLYTDKHGE